LGIFCWQVFRAAATPSFEFHELFLQLDEIGSKSLPLVALAGAATGVVLSMEARYSLTRFGAKSLLPAAIVFSVIHETGPIITGLVVSGRVGAGIGCGVGFDESDGADRRHRSIRGNPYRLLAATRIMACILMLPLLTLAADACGSNQRLPNDWIHDGLLPVSRFRVTAMPCQDSNALAVRPKESRIIRHPLVHLLAIKDEEL
jgi:phospholipid/cholesterol/gamma-HCH transport system permease protein